MKPRIAFITPPSPFLLDERVFPSLGILKVIAAAEALGYPVDHLDLNGVTHVEEAIQHYCNHHSTHLFAMTATTPQMVAATRIRDVIKKMGDNKIILGGPHATLVAAACKNGSLRAKPVFKELLDWYDVVVAGDGELAIEFALEEHAADFIDADDPKSPLFLTNKIIWMPARHHIDLDSYHYEIEDTRVTSIIGQLGCPFGCRFCAGRDSAMLRRVRLRPTASVIAEMRDIYHAYGIHGFMFLDDELNVNPKLLELLQAMDRLQHELQVEFRCRGFVKAELFTEEQAKALYRAGFRRMMCGFESGSDRILKNIHKQATRDDNTRAMEISHKYNLDMKALMSLGHPGESPETIRQSLDWLIEVQPSDFDLTIITPYPGSPYYDHSVYDHEDLWRFTINGDNLYMQDIDYTQTEDFYKGSMDSYKSYVETDFLTEDNIVRLRNAGETEVRNKLGIPFYQPRPYEASMGMMAVNNTILKF